MASQSHEQAHVRRLADQMNAWNADGWSDAPGARFLEAASGHARVEARLAAELPRLAASGTVLALGNAAALGASLSAVCPSGEPSPERLPVTLQLSVNVFRHPRHGTLTAEARTIYHGRNTLIVDVEIRDERRRLVATLAATHLTPAEARSPTRDALARRAS